MTGDTDAPAEQAARWTPGADGPSGRRRFLAIGIWGGCALVALALWAAYERFSLTIPTNSDGAGDALQSWAMLHGNWLLKGWTLTDVSFYTTELPQYMAVELATGLNANVIHVAAGMTYTLALLGAAVLAAGRGRGWAAVIGACIAAGIMLDPQSAVGVEVLLSSPDHIGTSVPIMAAWLILDRAGPNRRTVVAVSLVLGWGEVADSLVTYAAIAPLVLVVVIRLADSLIRDRGAPWRRTLAARRYEIALAVGAVAAAVAAHLALRLIRALGGFSSPGPTSSVAPLGRILGHNLPVVGRGLLLLFGADFLNDQVGLVIFLHLASVLLVVVGIGLAVRRFLADRDLVAQLLLAGIVVNLGVFIASTNVAGLPTMREVDVVLPFSAALAGRQLGPRIASALAAGSRSPRAISARLSWPLATGLLIALGIVGAGYAAGLADAIRTPVPASSEQLLAGWLEAHHLNDGLAGYWQSDSVTLFSEDKVGVRLVDVGYRLHPQILVKGTRESYAGWYDPTVNTTNFMVLAPDTSQFPGFTDLAAVTATFGQPTRTYHYDGYTILVWPHANLLTALAPAN